MVTGAREIVDCSDIALRDVRWFRRPATIRSNELRLLVLLLGNVMGEPTAVTFRRDAWFKAGPFKEGLTTLIDLDMWLRLSEQGLIFYMPQSLCRIRQHPASMTSVFRETGVVQDSVHRMTEELLRQTRAG